MNLDVVRASEKLFLIEQQSREVLIISLAACLVGDVRDVVIRSLKILQVLVFISA